MRKKSLSAAAAFLMSAAMVAGCASSDTAATTAAQKAAETTTATETTEATETKEVEDTTEAAETTEAEPTGDSGMTAMEVAHQMGNGINLGNTFEAYGHKSIGTKAATSSYETLWGAPVTTQEMITGMKEAGFDTLRIPIAWTNMMAYETGDYTIDEAYLERIKEVIDYAYNEDMYVIINDHWDGSWWGMFGSATEETVDEAWAIYESMWTQIAEYYKDYDYHLIFEGANEEIGDRLNDKDIASDSGTLSTDECYELSTEISQKFVDTVRATGGNNANRYLLIPGYNTDIQRTCDDSFNMPVDTADDKLMLSVHYYTPWNYCGDSTTVNQWGTTNDYETMNELLGMMSKFTDQGIPVIIGEYGVLTDGTYERDNTVDWMTNFLNNCDEYDMVPVLWDCSTLYSRSDCKMKFDDTAELFSGRSYANYSADKTIEEEAELAAAAIEAATAAAPATFSDGGFDPTDDTIAVAWIMWNSGDYSKSYSVGDDYNPDSITAQLSATDVQVTGEGEYTVGLDFTYTGESNGTAFSALAVNNGQALFPDYIMNITSLKINGEEYGEFVDGEYQYTDEDGNVLNFYTNSDNDVTTRVNLYNGWVTGLPDDARTIDGSLDNATPTTLDSNVQVNTIEITFDFVAPENAESYLADRDAWLSSVAAE